MIKEIEGTTGMIYDSARNGLQNELFRLQRLQETDGIRTDSLQEQIFDKLKQLSEMTDQERLVKLREELEPYK